MPEILVPDWPAPACIGAFVTTREGGVSLGPYASLNLAAHVGDDEANVRENRRRLRGRLPAEPLWLDQVHGNRCVRAECSQPGVRADAALARRPATVCAVMTADCLPVLLCDSGGSVVAAAHCGWRGLAAGILESALAGMEVEPESVLAYLGPAIGPASFEVGAQVRDAFVAREPGAASAFRAAAPGKWLADLYQLARQRLAAAGVVQVFGGGCDTYTDDKRFFSYRRSGRTGRMVAVIWRRT